MRWWDRHHQHNHHLVDFIKPDSEPMRRWVDVGGVCIVVGVLHQLHLVVTIIILMAAMVVIMIMGVMMITVVVVAQLRDFLTSSLNNNVKWC